VNGDAAPLDAYFYLSHFRPASTGVDYWVRKLYDDLLAAVRDRPRRHKELAIGTCDIMAPGKDRMDHVTRAVAGARVYVPLLSPDYVATPPAESRLFLDGKALRNSRVQPVLWVPLRPGQDVPQLRAAVELGSELRAYTKNGLEWMSRLRPHALDYQTVVRRLAGRIVEAAEQPGPPIQADQAVHPLPASRNEISFFIAVIAPNAGRTPPHTSLREANRHDNCYDSRSSDWRPFRNEFLPIAYHTERVAGSMRMPTRVVDFAGNDTFFDTSPGVILVDPWMLSVSAGREMVRTAFNALRPWVTMVVVVDRNDALYDTGSELAAEVMRIGHGNSHHTLMRDRGEFEQQIGRVIARARKHFLNRPPDDEPPAEPPPPPGPRPDPEEDNR
jgi:FxsC-like protein